MNASTGTHTFDQAVAMVGVSKSKIRYWVRCRLLPPAKLRRFDDDQVMRLRVIRALRLREMTLDNIRTWMKGKTSAELSAFISPSAAAIQRGEPPPLAFKSERFDRVTLAPGLELMVSDSAAPGVRRLADMIWKHFGPGENA